MKPTPVPEKSPGGFRNTGILYAAAPVLPNPATQERRYAYAVQGKWVTWGKMAFDQYFMTKMRLGVALPWFERLGLKAMFGVDLVKPVMAFDQEPVASA